VALQQPFGDHEAGRRPEDERGDEPSAARQGAACGHFDAGGTIAPGAAFVGGAVPYPLAFQSSSAQNVAAW
jgi:hypothetical protein